MEIAIIYVIWQKRGYKIVIHLSKAKLFTASWIGHGIEQFRVVLEGCPSGKPEKYLDGLNATYVA
jgi:hypothetical protein